MHYNTARTQAHERQLLAAQQRKPGAAAPPAHAGAVPWDPNPLPVSPPRARPDAAAAAAAGPGPRPAGFPLGPDYPGQPVVSQPAAAIYTAPRTVAAGKATQPENSALPATPRTVATAKPAAVPTAAAPPSQLRAQYVSLATAPPPADAHKPLAQAAAAAAPPPGGYSTVSVYPVPGPPPAAAPYRPTSVSVLPGTEARSSQPPPHPAADGAGVVPVRPTRPALPATPSWSGYPVGGPAEPARGAPTPAPAPAPAPAPTPAWGLVSTPAAPRAAPDGRTTPQPYTPAAAPPYVSASFPKAAPADAFATPQARAAQPGLTLENMPPWVPDQPEWPPARSAAAPESRVWMPDGYF
jgi:hypothetical protein